MSSSRRDAQERYKQELDSLYAQVGELQPERAAELQTRLRMFEPPIEHTESVVLPMYALYLFRSYLSIGSFVEDPWDRKSGALSLFHIPTF